MKILSKAAILISAVILSVFYNLNCVFAMDGPEGFTDFGNEQEWIINEAAPRSDRPALSQSKVSLDLKGLDIIDILKMLSQRSGFNIVVGKNVSGRVTIFLKDVDIWDAFEIILASNDLAYEVKGKIIYVMTDRDYELNYGERFGDKKKLLARTLKFVKAAEINKTLTQIKSNIGRIVIDEAANALIVLDTPDKIIQIGQIIDELDAPVQTRVFELRYAQAEKINTKVQEEITKGLGSIRVDERTNKVAITDRPDVITKIAKLIEAFDEKPRQVRIDAQIVEISPEKNEYRRGVDWDSWINKNFRFAQALPLGGPTTLSLGLAAGKVAAGEKYDHRGIIDLLSTIGKTKILSSPSIMVLNNQEAKILVGTKEAYITSSTSQAGTGTQVTAQSVNFVDVGIKLYVTPTINKDGYVTMKIKPEVSSSKLTDLTSEGKITQVPIVTTSEAETTVALKDGMTLVIAGLKKDKKEGEIKKIPLLGDIPVLGFPFRSVSKAHTKTELVIFLTPHIVDDYAPPKYTTLSKDEELANLVRKTEIYRMPPSQTVRVQEGTCADVSQIDTYTAITSRQMVPGDANEYYEYIRQNIFSVLRLMNDSSHLRGRALVSFVLSSNGQLKGQPEVLSATSPELKAPSINAIRSLAPFARFPADLQKPEESFQVTLVFN